MFGCHHDEIRFSQQSHNNQNIIPRKKKHKNCLDYFGIRPFLSLNTYSNSTTSELERAET